MIKEILVFLLLVAVAALPSLAIGASPSNLTACVVVTVADAQRLVGAPLDAREFAKVPTSNGPGSYDSICTYISKGGDFENTVTAPRLLDLTLHFLNSAGEMKKIYESSVEEYRRMAKSPEAPYKGATLTPLKGFGDGAFALEAVTDPKTGYKSALIVFYKGRAGGSVTAWKKPEPSLQTTKTALKHILSKLP